MSRRFLTRSVDETRRLAGDLAPLARAGDVILLAGELGAGKTAFVQGFARAMGVEEHVTSPTFTLMHTYTGRLQLLHVDVYRLDHLQEINDLGLAELVDESSVALIEWGDMAEPVLPADFLEIRIEYGPGDDDRVFGLRPVGSPWGARARALDDALAVWAQP